MNMRIDTVGRCTGIGGRHIYKALRERGLLAPDNLPTTAGTQSGFFIVSHRQVHPAHWGKPKDYSIALLTQRGQTYARNILARQIIKAKK